MISSESAPIFAIYEEATGFIVTFGTSHILDHALADGLLGFPVPYGMSPLRKKVDLATMTLVDLVIQNDPEEERMLLLTPIRQRRNSLLAATDYLLMPDYPLTDEQRVKLQAYRQALREVTDQPDLNNVVWPAPWNA